jgi:hypothetical protein
MAASIVEQHTYPNGYFIRMRFTAQDDTLTFEFPVPMRQLAGESNIIAGGTLSAYTVTGLIGLNPTIAPAEAGFVVTQADKFDLKTTEPPFRIMKITTTAWTGASTLEVTASGRW